MKSVLSILPNLIGRLSVSRKLILIYLLDLVGVIFVTSILIEEKFIAINFARKELNGNAHISLVCDVLSGVSQGHPLGSIPKRGVDNSDRSIALDASHTALTPELRDRLHSFTQQAHSLRSDSSRLPLIILGQKLVSQIGDQSNLILDPDLDSYYTMSLVVLRFPELLRLLQQLPPPDQKQRNGTALMIDGQISALIANIESDYASAFASNADASLAPQLQSSKSKLIPALHTLQDAVRQGHRQKFTSLQGQAVADTFHAWKEANKALDRLLVARVERLFTRMWVHLGMAASLLIIILFFVFYIARQISLPLRRLATVAREVQTQNDYTLRASWNSSDEIGHLVNGFNTMLDRLDRERLVQQQLAAQAGAAKAQQELLEAIPIPLLVTAIPEHRILHANAPASVWVDTENRTDPWSVGLSSGDRARFFQRIADQGVVHEFEANWRGTKQNEWALLSARRLDYQGQDSVLTTFSPINDIKRFQARLKIWASVFEASSEGILVYDRDNHVMLANAAITRTTGYHVEELLGTGPEFLSSPRQDEGTSRMIRQALSGKRAWQGEFLLRRKSGEDVPHLLAINTVRDEQGLPTHTIALFVDISDRKAQEERIRHLAHHDALTGLPNRLLFDERLHMSLQQAERHKTRGALMFIDLDRFKNINDSLGHAVGDALLCSVAARLVDSVRAGDTVCRQGGDEFVIVLHDIADEQEVVHVVEGRLIPLIRKTHSVSGVEIHTSCSIGVTIFPDDGNDIETLMRNADAAMYVAKSDGRNNFKFFSEEMNRNALERMHIENSLHRALEEKQFELYLQPVICADTGELMAAEALIRWHHPAMGLMPPTTFIPVAEQSGQIVAIGSWVIEEACRLHARWSAAGLGELPVSVNVSAIQLQRGGFVDVVMAAIEMYQVPPHCLQLELTETLVMTGSQSTLDDLQRLKEAGVELSLDDFGTGYSSLSYLHRFPFNKLKIDRSFVCDMIEDPADLVITRTIITLGHSLGLRVVAEGVEHYEELKILRQAGCEEVQGYLISEPLPDWEFERWLYEWRNGGCSELINKG